MSLKIKNNKYQMNKKNIKVQFNKFKIKEKQFKYLNKKVTKKTIEQK